MLRIIVGDLYNAETDCIVIPVKEDMVLEGAISDKAKTLLGEQGERDIKKLKPIKYTEATSIYSHGKIRAEEIILVANTWTDHYNKTKTEKFLQQSYESCFKLAIEDGLKSIAFPALSTGFYGINLLTSFLCMTHIFEKYKDQIEQVDFYVYNYEKYRYYKPFFVSESEDFNNGEAIILIENKNLPKYAYSNERRFLNGRTLIETSVFDPDSTEYIEFKDLLVYAKSLSKISNLTIEDIIYEVCAQNTFKKYISGERVIPRIKLIGMLINMRLESKEINKVLQKRKEQLNPGIKEDGIIINAIDDKTILFDHETINEYLALRGVKPIFKINK